MGRNAKEKKQKKNRGARGGQLGSKPIPNFYETGRICQVVFCLVFFVSFVPVPCFLVFLAEPRSGLVILATAR